MVCSGCDLQCEVVADQMQKPMRLVISNDEALSGKLGDGGAGSVMPAKEELGNDDIGTVRGDVLLETETYSRQSNVMMLRGRSRAVRGAESVSECFTMKQQEISQQSKAW